MKKRTILASLLICLLCSCGTMEHNGTAGSKVAVEPEVTMEKESKPEPSENEEEEVSTPTASEDESEDDFEESEDDYLDEMEEDDPLEAVSLKYDVHVENDIDHIIKITNLKTKQSTTMKIDDELQLGNCIDKVLWINDTTLAVIMHANPSLSVLFVIDADKEKILYTKYGSAFYWVDDNPKSLLYVELAPHFSKATGHDKIKNYEDDTLFQTGEEEQIVGFDISKEDGTISYVINDKKDEETVYYADYKKKEKKLRTTKKEKLRITRG